MVSIKNIEYQQLSVISRIGYELFYYVLIRKLQEYFLFLILVSYFLFRISNFLLFRSTYDTHGYPYLLQIKASHYHM